MQTFFEKIKQLLQPIIAKVYLKIRSLLDYLDYQYNKIDYYYKTHPKARKWSIIGAIFFGPPLLFLLVVWIEIPSNRELRKIQNQVASEVYSADSVLLGRYYFQDRTEVKFEDIAPVVRYALIATEDSRFYTHGGVDFTSLGRVLIKSIFLQDESSGGGSTITQQLAKNLYPRKQYWLLSLPINKIREIITALRLENLYNKDELITLYLNTIPFAEQAFGIEAAALRFYSTSAKDLTASQAALLIGMLKATNSYNPKLFPKRALVRRNIVLERMAKHKFITKQLRDSLKKMPLGLNYRNVSYHQGLAPYFREYLKKELMVWCKNNTKDDGTPYNIYTDGLKIYTTIDSHLQKYAEKAVDQQMAEIQKQFFDHWGKQTVLSGNEAIVRDAVHRSPRYQTLKADGLSEREIMEVLKKKIPMRIFTWKGEESKLISPLDSIKHHIQYLNAGFIAMEPQTGKVLAWVGGINHDFFQFDHVKISTKRQVGSIFKPIVYAMAIDKGVPPCEFISAERQTYIDKEGEKWTPRNSQIDYQVKYSMSGALAYSVNTIAVKLIERGGVQNTISLAHKMGIVSEIPDVPSIALGASSISLIEMTTAYACFNNDGVSVRPMFITSIQTSDGGVIGPFKPEVGKRVLSKKTTQLVIRLMQNVIHEGTASRLRWKYGIYNDVAGKTGTTQSNADGWFIAGTPGLVVGTWVGGDDPRVRFRNTELGQGSNTALPLYAYFMKQVNKDPAYSSISNAHFPTLSPALQQELSCDLYQLDDDLIQDILYSIQKRDSTMIADTLKKTVEDSYLQKLYKRKLKIESSRKNIDSAVVGSPNPVLIN